jgi:hypothetical protein
MVFLAIAITLPLMALAVALVPAWALPRFVSSLVDERRAEVVLVGIVGPLGIGLGLLVALVLT